MALTDQYLRLRFLQGVDTEPDEKGLPAGKLTRLENGTFEKAITLEKRPGHEKLTRQNNSLDVVSGALDLWSDGSTLYRHDGRSSVYRWGSDGAWRLIGHMRSPTVDTQRIVKGPIERWNGDAATTGSVTLAVWEEPDGVHAAALDAETMIPILGPQLIAASATRPRAAVCGTQLHAYFVVGGQLSSAELNPFDLNTSWAAITGSAMTSDAAFVAGNSYDVVGYNGAVVVAYPTATDVKIANIAPIGSFATPSTAFSRTAPTGSALGIANAGPSICVSPQGILHVSIWSTGSGINSRPFDATSFIAYHKVLSTDNGTTSAGGDTVVRMASVCERERGGLPDFVTNREMLFYEVTSSAGSRVNMLGTGVSGSGFTTTPQAAVSASIVAHRARIVGHPYAIDADVYCPMMSTEPTQQTVVFAGTGSASVVKLLPGLASSLTSGTVPGWTVLPDAREAIVLGRRDQVPTFFNSTGDITGSAFSDRGLALATFDWHATASLGWATKDGYVFVGGGQVNLLDGGSATELGFNVYPEGSTYTTTQYGSMTAGTRQYSPVYEWNDQYGNRHHSTGEIISVTTTASVSAVVCQIPTPQFTEKPDGSVRVALFRTAAGGTSFFRADSPTKPIVLSSTASFHTFSDTISDATLVTKELDPRMVFVEDIAPPAARHVSVVKGRVMLAGIEGRPQDVWYSKLGQDGDGPSFSDALTFTVPAEGGPITGLGQIDANGIVFKKDRAMAFGGDGPTDLETDTALFSEAQTVSIDAGCVDSRSIVSVQGTEAQGLIFKSQKGYKLLDRSLNMHDIGAPVTDHDGLRVSSALREPGSDQVRFLTQDGLSMMYDSRWGHWGTYTDCEGVGAAVWDGRYAFLKSDGTVLVSSTGSRDGTTVYPMLIETGWLTFNGLQGYARCRSIHILGSYYSPHTLRVDVAYDYRGYSETHEIPSSRIVRIHGYGDGYYGGLTGTLELTSSSGFRVTYPNLNNDSVSIPSGTYTWTTLSSSINSQMDQTYATFRIDSSGYAIFDYVPTDASGIQINWAASDLGLDTTGVDIRDALGFSGSVLNTNTPVTGSSVVSGNTGSYGVYVYGGASDPVYQVKIGLKRQRCQAIRLRIRDVPPPSGGKSMSISEVALTVAVEKGQARLSSRKRSG